MNRLKDLNWNQLYYFYEVARHQSLKASAEFLSMAPSTLSEHLKKLEHSLGQKLFVRTSKGLSLNNRGYQLFEHAKIIFAEGSKLFEKFSEHNVGGYSVNVGLVETVTNDLVSEFSSRYWDFFAPYGTVNTIRQAEHEHLVDNLIQGHIDWGISFRPPKRKSLDYGQIGSFDIAFLCADELYDKFKSPKDLLIHIPLAENPNEVELNKRITKHLQEAEVIPKEKIYSDHPDYVRRLCQRGRCVMSVAESSHEEYEGLKKLGLGNPLVVELFALWRKQDESLVFIKKLNELIHWTFKKLPERYEDVNLQIEVSDISDELLR